MTEKWDIENDVVPPLKEAGINRKSHITKFAESLELNDCGVVPLQKQKNSKRLAVKKASFKSVVQNQECFFLLGKVIAPVRDKIFSRRPTPELSDLDASQS